MSALAFATIVSKNYLPFARTLALSVAEHHPEARMVVLLVDRVDGRFDPAAEPFELVEVEELGIEDFPSFAFKYSILEINTAVKPAFLAHLFAGDGGLEELVYLDPDILLYRPLAEVRRRLAEHAIVLTPHLTAPIDDPYHPSETSILQAGAYNLGFIGLRRGELVDRMLAWWGERMAELCVVDVERGLFVDQKWIDLVPGLFPDVAVLTHPGYNVAYWNLHERRVGGGGEGPEVNGEALAFFHFSGFDPDDPQRVSKHQNRFDLGSVGEARALFEDYGRRLQANGFEATRGWPYAFGRFADEVAIPPLARSLYRSLGAERRRFGDPFAVGPESFRAWANEPARRAGAGAPYLSNLLYHLYRSRPDLLLAYPDVFDRDLARFARWLDEGGQRELGLDEPFLAPLAPLAAAPAASPLAAVGGGARRTVRRVNASPLGGRIKRRLKRWLGEERWQALRRRVPGLAPQAEAGGVAAPLASLAITRPGLNVAGYLAAESGMGEGARGIVRAAEAASVPCALTHLDLHVASRMSDRSFSGRSATDEYDVNLLFVNADQVPHVVGHLGRERFRRRVNIGYWLWELAEFPRRWRSSFEPFHEIWTASTFCLDAIAAASPIPVRRIGLPVGFTPPAAAARSTFGLPEDRFVFLFVFDFLSYLERKNPRALVRAFKRAFRADDRVLLVLKSVNAERNPEGRAELEEEARGWPVEIVDGYYDKDRVHQLMAVADCYASLHRTEGFGLTLAEAMVLGKPVIATDYSGNTDFMTVDNSFPVAYRLVEIEDDEGPYPRGAIWAEPDVEHAAALMRRVYEDREAARAVGERGRRHVERHHGVEAVGAAIRHQLERLAAEVHGEPGPAR